MKALSTITLSATLTACLLVSSSPAFGQTSKVIKLKASTPNVFELTDGRYRKSGKLDAASLALPATVVNQSPKGYVQLQSSNGAIWLDKLDVVLDPPLNIKASCLTGVSVASDAVSAVTRGAGEGCGR